MATAPSRPSFPLLRGPWVTRPITVRRQPVLQNRPLPSPLPSLPKSPRNPTSQTQGACLAITLDGEESPSCHPLCWTHRRLGREERKWRKIQLSPSKAGTWEEAQSPHSLETLDLGERCRGRCRPPTAPTVLEESIQGGWVGEGCRKVSVWGRGSSSRLTPGPRRDDRDSGQVWVAFFSIQSSPARRIWRGLSPPVPHPGHSQRLPSSIPVWKDFHLGHTSRARGWRAACRIGQRMSARSPGLRAAGRPPRPPRHLQGSATPAQGVPEGGARVPPGRGRELCPCTFVLGDGRPQPLFWPLERLMGLNPGPLALFPAQGSDLLWKQIPLPAGRGPSVSGGRE